VDTRPFHFKTFSLHHHRSTMKVGTDAVLLGIWTDLTGVKSVLDVGTGCGIISLLLASREPVSVDAVEKDQDSFEEASQNFVESSFFDRLRIFHSDFNDFVPPENKKYDLIVSNPPFFINDLQSKNAKKSLARHTQTLTYELLVKVAQTLLNPNGKIAVVLPYRESRFFLQAAQDAGFFVEKKMLIFPVLGREPNRINLLLSRKPVDEQTEKFTIRDEDGKFTSQYVEFVKDYYLSI
jgi:tRNA1Val (adenine37-N6)-methyltransferase